MDSINNKNLQTVERHPVERQNKSHGDMREPLLNGHTFNEVFMSGFNGPEGIQKNPNHKKKSRERQYKVNGSFILNSQLSERGYNTTPYISNFTIYIRSDFKSVSIPTGLRSDVSLLSSGKSNKFIWDDIRTQYVKSLNFLWRAKFFRKDFTGAHRGIYLAILLKYRHYNDMWGRPLEIRNKDLRSFLTIIKHFRYFSRKLATDFCERWLDTTDNNNMAIGHMKTTQPVNKPSDTVIKKLSECFSTETTTDKKETKETNIGTGFLESKIKQTFANVMDDVSKDKNVGEKVGKIIKTALSWLKDDLFSNIQQGCDDFFAYFKTLFDSIVQWFKTTFGEINLLFRQWAAQSKAYFFLMFTKIAEVLDAQASLLYEYFKNIFQDFMGIDISDSDTVEAHSLGGNVISFILRCVLKITGVPLDNLELGLIRESISLADNLIENSKTFFMSLMYAFTGDYKYLYGNVGLEVLKFVRVVSDIMEDSRFEASLKHDPDFREDILALRTNINKYKMELAMKKGLSPTYNGTLTSLVTALSKSLSANTLITSHTRKSATLIVMNGPPGGGKSTISEVLRLFMKWLYAGASYVRTPNTDFHDGGEGAKVWVCPDFAQKTDITERAKEMEEIIRFVSGEQVPLTMSAVESKGKFYYEAEGHIVTTNANLDRETFGVVDTGAFKRRGIHVTVNRKQNVDFTAGVSWSTFRAIADEAWSLQVHVAYGEGTDLGYKGGRDFLERYCGFDKAHFHKSCSTIKISFSKLMDGVFLRYQDRNTVEEPQEALEGLDAELSEMFSFDPHMINGGKLKVEETRSKPGMARDLENAGIDPSTATFQEKANAVLNGIIGSASGHCITDTECPCGALTTRTKNRIIAYVMPYFKASSNKTLHGIVLDVWLRMIYDMGYTCQARYWAKHPGEFLSSFMLDTKPMTALIDCMLVLHKLLLLKEFPKQEGDVKFKDCYFTYESLQEVDPLSFIEEIGEGPFQNEKKNLDRISRMGLYAILENVPMKVDWGLLSFVVLTAGALGAIIGGIAIAVQAIVDKVSGHGEASDAMKKRIRKKPNTVSIDRKGLEGLSAGHALSKPPDSMLHRVRMNMRKVTVVDKSGGNMTVNAMFIGDLTMAINRHTGIEYSSHVVLSGFDNKSNIHGKTTVSHRDYDVRVTENSDLAFVTFHRGVSNINQAVVLEKYMYRGSLQTIPIDTVFRLDPRDGSLEKVAIPYPINRPKNIDCMPNLWVKDYWAVPGLRSQAGHCGMPYLSKVGQEWKILFIHAASLPNGSAGIIPFVEHDMVKGHAAKGVDWTSDVEKIFASGRSERGFDICMASRISNSTVNYPGTGGMTYKPHPWSEYYDPEIIPKEKRPIPRTGNHTHDKFREKRLRNIEPTTDDFKRLVVDDPGSLFEGIVTKFPVWEGGVRIRSNEEVLMDCEYFQTLSKDSSEGLWKQLKKPGTPGKKEIVDSGIIPEDLEDKVEERMTLLENDICPLSLTALATKAETLPYPKDYPRIFMPIMYPDNIMWKRIMGDLMQLLSTNPTLLCMARYNPHGIQANMLYEKLTRFQKYIATDAKGLDNSQRPLMAHLFGLFMAGLTGKPEDDFHYRAVYILCANVTQYLFVFRDGVYHSHMGLPSGSFITALFNAFSMYVVLKYLCMVAYPGVPIEDIIAFMCFGDDTAGSVNSKYKLVNMMTYSHMASLNFGYTLTNSEKELVSYKYEKEIPDFLSRRFNFVEGRVAHALSLSSICGFLHWSQKSTPREEILQQTINVALMELVYHGRETFDKFRAQFVMAASKAGDIANIKNWNYYYKRWVSGYLGTQYNDNPFTDSDFVLSWFDDYGPDVSGKFLDVGQQQANGHSLRAPANVIPLCMTDTDEAVGKVCQTSLAFQTGMTNPLQRVAEQKENGGSLDFADNQEFQEENVVQLTELDKVEGEVEQNATDNNTVLSPGHYAMSLKDTPTEILSRKYIIGNYTITNGGNLHGTDIGFQNIYSDHVLPYNIINKFKYFRCDGIEFDISVTAPVSMAGFLSVYWYPCEPQNKNLPIYLKRRSWKKFLPNGGTIIAASESESTKLTVNWQAPFKFARNATLPISPDWAYPDLTVQLKSLGNLYIEAPKLTQLDVASPSVTLRIFASYINPVVQAPRTAETAVGHSQASRIDNTLRTIGSTIANVGTIMTASNLKMFMNSWSTANKAFKDAQVLYGETQSLMGQDPGENAPAQHISVRQSVWGDTASLRNEVGMLNLGDNSNTYAVKPCDTGTDDDIDLYELCKRWQYVGDWTYNMSNTGTQNAVEFKVGPSFLPEGYLPYFARFFRFWRGSMHCKIMFFGSPLVTYNALIVVQPTNRRVDIGSDSSFSIGDYITNNITVRGTTVIDVVVPFVRPTAWEYMGAWETFQVSVDVWPIGTVQGGVVQNLPIVMLARAGDDFRFRGLCSPSLQADPNAIDIGGTEYNFPPNFEPEGMAIGHGLLDHADTVMDISGGNIVPLYEYQAFHGTLHDMLVRYSIRQDRDFLGVPGRSIVDSSTAGEMSAELSATDSFDWIAALYVGFSGSMRIKAQFDPDGQVGNDDLVVYMDNDVRQNGTVNREPTDVRGGDGIYRTKLRVWPIVETEIPYFNVWPWSPHSTDTFRLQWTDPGDGENYVMQYVEDPVRAYVAGQSTTPALVNNSMVQAGQDFAFHVLLPPFGDDTLPPLVEHVYGVPRVTPPPAKSLEMTNITGERAIARVETLKRI